VNKSNIFDKAGLIEVLIKHKWDIVIIKDVGCQ